MTGCSSVATCIVTYWPAFFDVAFSVIAVASAVAAMTPTPADDNWVGKAYRFVDMLALNFGYAKEKAAKTGGRFVPE
ncbi:MAG: hypothetical protein AAF322_06475 [Pseudomonadota bacterium]